MTTTNQCDVCGRTAMYHDTSVGGEITERHLCGRHGQGLFLMAMKDVLTSQVKQIPTSWRATPGSDAQLKERIAKAPSWREIRKLFRPDAIAASLRPEPPMR